MSFWKWSFSNVTKYQVGKNLNLCSVFIILTNCFYPFFEAVVVSESSVQAFVGTNALLPCDCPAKKSLSWQDANNLVITGISEDGYEANHPQFINRTQLFKHRDENNCSLLILGVKVEDQGKYACHSLRPLHTEFVELKVMGKRTVIVI